MLRRTTRVLLAAAFAAAAALWCAPARAACPGGTATAAKAYADARRAFEEKRYDESIALLHRAYACDPNPVYLGNVARTLEEARRPKEALAAWRTFREVTTDPKERTQIDGRISALSKVVEELDQLEKDKLAAEEARRKAEEDRRTSAAAVPPPAREAPPEPAPRVATAAFIVTGVGVAGLATGVVLALVAGGKHSSAVDERDVVRAESLQSGARTFATAANVVLVAGGVVAAAGVTWIGFDLFGRQPSSPRAALVVHPSSIALEGRF